MGSSLVALLYDSGFMTAERLFETRGPSSPGHEGGASSFLGSVAPQLPERGFKDQILFLGPSDRNIVWKQSRMVSQRLDQGVGERHVVEVQN